VANLIEVVIYISHYLAKKINENDGKRLHSKLQNTSFIELINGDSQILAWNYDKGREIGIRVYDDNNVPYDADTIITSLLHELAHSICKTVGHNTEWEEKNNYLQGFKGIYIEYLINNTFINK
jgi:glutathionyl-hydroquinone reductase